MSKQKNLDGKDATLQIIETEDVAAEGIQKPFKEQINKGGFAYVTGEGDLVVKLVGDDSFRTIPVSGGNQYTLFKIKEFDVAESTEGIVNHFGR